MAVGVERKVAKREVQFEEEKKEEGENRS